MGRDTQVPPRPDVVAVSVSRPPVPAPGSTWPRLVAPAALAWFLAEERWRHEGM